MKALVRKQVTVPLDRVELVYPTLFGSAKKIVFHPQVNVLPEQLSHLQRGLPEEDRTHRCLTRRQPSSAIRRRYSLDARE